jgi:hypothetical protein
MKEGGDQDCSTVNYEVWGMMRRCEIQEKKKKSDYDYVSVCTNPTLLYLYSTWCLTFVQVDSLEPFQAQKV